LTFWKGLPVLGHPTLYRSRMFSSRRQKTVH